MIDQHEPADENVDPKAEPNPDEPATETEELPADVPDGDISDREEDTEEDEEDEEE